MSHDSLGIRWNRLQVDRYGSECVLSKEDRTGSILHLKLKEYLDFQGILASEMNL